MPIATLNSLLQRLILHSESCIQSVNNIFFYEGSTFKDIYRLHASLQLSSSDSHRSTAASTLMIFFHRNEIWMFEQLFCPGPQNMAAFCPDVPQFVTTRANVSQALQIYLQLRSCKYQRHFWHVLKSRNLCLCCRELCPCEIEVASNLALLTKLIYR